MTIFHHLQDGIFIDIVLSVCGRESHFSRAIATGSRCRYQRQPPFSVFMSSFLWITLCFKITMLICLDKSPSMQGGVYDIDKMMSKMPEKWTSSYSSWTSSCYMYTVFFFSRLAQWRLTLVTYVLIGRLFYSSISKYQRVD